MPYPTLQELPNNPVDENDKYKKFEIELTNLINRLSLEQKSNTHDFVLAKYLVECLKSYETVVITTNHLKNN